MKERKMTKCICGGALTDIDIERHCIKLNAQKCKTCNEIFIPGSEMLRYDILTGRSQLVRKIRKTGDSLAVTLPKQIVEKFKVHENDMVYFKPRDKDIEIEVIHTEKK